MISDKSCCIQVLGGLMKNPLLLGQVDKYSFNITDFSGRLEKYIFMAIGNLFENGARTIEPIDVINTLETDASAYATFTSQNGVEYLQDAIEFSNLENFDYYYLKLKKLNLLKDLNKQGINTDEFYCEDLTNPKATEINRRFEELTNQDIIEAIKKKLLRLESAYAKSEEIVTENAADDIDDFIAEIGTTVKIGLPIQGEIYNQIIDGAQLGTLTIRSGCSGLGKTRQAVGDACLLAYPIRYNSQTEQWEYHGSCEKVLFIITEQQMSQIRNMILAYLTDLNESKFKYGTLTEREKKLVAQAGEIMKMYKDNFIIQRMPNPTIGLVKTMIREQCLINDIHYVFYDYIFIGPALLGEFRGFNLRNDELLLMFSTALKDLAVELNVCIMTSTQVSAAAEDSKHIRNESSLAGGRATINKADNGAIMARPSKDELDTLKAICEQYGTPNMVTDIFKVRSGEYTQVRIWSKVNLGTMKKQDLFITDERMDVIENFYCRPRFEVVNFEDEEILKIMGKVNELNGL